MFMCWVDTSFICRLGCVPFMGLSGWGSFTGYVSFIVYLYVSFTVGDSWGGGKYRGYIEVECG